jgi:hypothetical protein
MWRFVAHQTQLRYSKVKVTLWAAQDSCPKFYFHMPAWRYFNKHSRQMFFIARQNVARKNLDVCGKGQGQGHTEGLKVK